MYKFYNGKEKSERQPAKKIIKAFYEVAKIEATENTSFAKIAKALDMPPSLIVHYFNSREELLLGLIDFIIENYKGSDQPIAKSDADALEKLITILNNIFSRRWNDLIDDGVFYSCFALVFRDQYIRKSFRGMHFLLRKWLADAIQDCVDQQLLAVEDPAKTADLIFVIADGVYYFLSVIDDDALYQEKLNMYKQEACKILNLSI